MASEEPQSPAPQFGAIRRPSCQMDSISSKDILSSALVSPELPPLALLTLLLPLVRMLTPQGNRGRKLKRKLLFFTNYEIHHIKKQKLCVLNRTHPPLFFWSVTNGTIDND